jgi:hypothetical protein
MTNILWHLTIWPMWFKIFCFDPIFVMYFHFELDFHDVPFVFHLNVFSPYTRATFTKFIGLTPSAPQPLFGHTNAHKQFFLGDTTYHNNQICGLSLRNGWKLWWRSNFSCKWFHRFQFNMLWYFINFHVFSCFRVI